MKHLANLLVTIAGIAMSPCTIQALPLDSAWSRNEDSYLLFPAYYQGWNPEQCAQCAETSHALHPAVQFSSRGFLGYRFWMAYTPLCISEFDENPHIAVSNDGRLWSLFESAEGVQLLNPVFSRQTFNANHLSDPDLLLMADSALYLFFRATWEIPGIDSSAVFVSVSTDGVSWSVPARILSDGMLGQGERSAFLSLSVVSDGDGLFSIYVVEPRLEGVSTLDTSRVVRYRSAELTGPWQFHDTCEIVLPSDSLKVWHLEVVEDSVLGEIALLNLVPNTPLNGGDSAELYLAAYDSVAASWIAAAQPVLSWREDPSAWYGRRIYRASGIWFEGAEGPILWLYYSAYAFRVNQGGTGTGWQTGLTWVVFDTTLGPAVMCPTVKDEPNLRHVVGLEPTIQWLFADPVFHRQQDEAVARVWAGVDTTQAPFWEGVLAGAGNEMLIGDGTFELGTEYAARVRARSEASWSVGASLFFRTNAAPDAPVCLFPISGIGTPLYELRPDFRWTGAIDPDSGDTVNYTFLLSITPQGVAEVEATVVLPSLRLADSLQVSRKYYWQVRACDQNAACSPASEAALRTFLPGDINGDFGVSVADLTKLVGFLFKGEVWSVPEVAGEVDGVCGVSVGDLTFMVSYLFRGGSAPRIGCGP